jgi:protein SCO1/2
VTAPILTACVVWLAACAASAQPLALPAPPRAALEQRMGATVPLDVATLDEGGRRHRLGDAIDGTKPVVLVAGYYRCPQLCGLLMHSLLEALHASGVPRTQWRIVRFSIDPQETPADARVRRELDTGYARTLLDPQERATPLDLRLLTVAPADVQRLTRAIGYGFEALAAGPGPGGERFAHPASFVVLTPDGRVSRYFNGVAFDPRELRVALADAAGDHVGAVTGRLALLCAHFDPRVGRRTEAVMTAIRAGSLLLPVALAVAVWCWRRRAGGRR